MTTYTTRMALPKPEGSDPPNGAAQIAALADAIDGHPGIAVMSSGTRDQLSGNARWVGRIIYNSTTGYLQQWSGTTWTGVSIDRLVALRAKGDLLGYTGSDVTRIPAGTAGQALLVDSAAPAGLKFGDPRDASKVAKAGDTMSGQLGLESPTWEAELVGSDSVLSVSFAAVGAGVVRSAYSGPLTIVWNDIPTGNRVTVVRLAIPPAVPSITWPAGTRFAHETAPSLTSGGVSDTWLLAVARAGTVTVGEMFTRPVRVYTGSVPADGTIKQAHGLGVLNSNRVSNVLVTTKGPSGESVPVRSDLVRIDGVHVHVFGQTALVPYRIFVTLGPMPPGW